MNTPFLSDFANEARMELRSIDRELDQWIKAPPASLTLSIQQLHRAVQRVRYAASFLEIRSITSLALRLEEVFFLLRNSTRLPPMNMIVTLKRVTQHLIATIERLVESANETKQLSGGLLCSDSPEIEERFRQAFVQECLTHLEEIQSLLDVVQATNNMEQIHAILRKFHTIKSSAGFVEAEDAVLCAHQMEELLCEVRNHARPLDACLRNTIYSGVDTIRNCLLTLRP